MHKLDDISHILKKINPKTIGIIGSRNANDALIFSVIDEIIKLMSSEIIIVSGGARGADKYGEIYAKNNKLKTIIHLPEWNLYGKKAGFKRNYKIIQDSNVILAFWDYKSNGTKHSLNIAKKLHKPAIIAKLDALGKFNNSIELINIPNLKAISNSTLEL